MVLRLSSLGLVWLSTLIAQNAAGPALNFTAARLVEPKVSQNGASSLHPNATNSVVSAPSRTPQSGALPKPDGGATIQADCKTATVGSPYNTCYDIYTAAKITAAQFNSYNPGLNCALIQPGQKVCISAGTLPSNAPKPNPDGSCYVYTVQSGDTCSAIAAKYTITVANIEAWNAKTYKWTGCNGLQIGFKMCLSTGTPPAIPTNPDLQCGPESVGNKTCPLKACCSAFGYCGLTSEFCTTTGPNPCIQNCGLPTLPSCSGSAKRKLGYYAGWAKRRKCTTVGPDQIDLTGFTHVNFAFATISQDYKIVIDSQDDPLLKGLVARKKDVSGLKVMIAVGGWAFSQEDPTKDLFTKMIATSGTRSTFITSVAAFLSQYGLDGIDIDFEYPSAVERGGPPSDTPNLTALVTEMRSKLSGSLISVAAPAGYWFLRGFEVDKIASKLDHINMMSYDYHGPWDTNVTGQAPVSNPHTSILDLTDSTLLYTRAGIDLSKVNLGLAWYGRTFHLADAGCKGYGCTMTGGGAKGACTDASGVLAQFEVNDLMNGITPTYDDKTKTYWFNKNGDLITFDQDKSWQAKVDFANSHCFGGTFVWSMDQVKPKDPPPPDDPKPPVGCSNFDFVGWAKEAADLNMDRFFDSGEAACWCWDTTNWHTYNGVEAMLDYIWGFGLKDTAYEKRIVSELNTGVLQPGRFEDNSGSSNDDALWGALMLMKMGDYLAQVKGDIDSLDKYYDWARQIMEWTDDGREDSPCAPGLYWKRPTTYQNTVVNALYMHASLRQYFYSNDKKYLDAATELLTGFFDKFGLKNSDGLYIDGLSDDCNPGDGTTWTYNQGVMLSSFGMLFKATGDSKYIARGNDLINAVRTHLTKDGILAEVCDDAAKSNGGSCNFDQEGFKGIFMRHMQYFYDAVGRDSSLRNDKDEWHTDWMGLNARGIHQYARRAGDHNLSNIWYTVTENGAKQTGWTHISGMSGLVSAVKWGTCSA